MQQLNAFGEIKESQYTCIVKSENKVVFTSMDKGVKPLLDYIGEKNDYQHITIIDKIIGKGAMCLAIKGKAEKVITPIISEKALEIAKAYDVDIAYEKVVPYIINRTRTGSCPIEKAVSTTDDVEEAYHIIIDTLKKLRSGSI